jgi:hypothetical protein
MSSINSSAERSFSNGCMYIRSPSLVTAKIIEESTLSASSCRSTSLLSNCSRDFFGIGAVLSF